jgi:hypothetical protein
MKMMLGNTSTAVPKQVVRYTGAEGYIVMKRMAYNKSRCKVANQSKY